MGGEFDGDVWIGDFVGTSLLAKSVAVSLIGTFTLDVLNVLLDKK